MSIGNLKDSGNQGNNFPWQLKMLLGQQCACDELAAINDNTDQVEFLLSAILTSLQDSNEYEAKFVVDTCDVARTVYLEVRIWDPTPPPGSWGPITYYLPGSSTPVVPPGAGTPGCLQYMDPTGILGMIYNVLNTRLDVNLSTIASESTLSTLNAKFVSGTDIGDVTINNAGGGAAVNIQDGGNSITVDGTVELGATTLTALENITVQNGAGSSAVNIQDGGNSITVDANNLDIRDLVFATDKVDVSNSTIALDVTTLTALENITVQNGAGASAVNIQDGGNSITVDGGTGVQRTPTFLRPTGTFGTVTAGAYSVSFASVGTANATVGGITLKTGETLNFDAGAINNTLAAITYNTTTAGAELIIITLT